ncbi:MAG: molybdopterin-dependent oxidoreductase [Chloroflexota bacterium]
MPDRLRDARPIPVTCTLDCGSRCALIAWVRDGRLLRLDTPAGDDTVERPRLVACVRGRAHRRLLHAPERALQPLRRVGPRGSGQFAPIAWDEALDLVAARLEEVRARYGTEAVFHAAGAGSISGRGFSGAAASRRFFSYWGPVTGTVGSLSNHAVNMAAQWMLGGVVPGSDRATLLHSRLIILWGMNPAETHMGPNTEYFIAQARDLGAHVVLIDPRYTDSGVLADEWIPIRPGTDVALAAALAYVMETEGLADSAFLETHTRGYDDYRRYVLGADDGVPKTPEWAEAITGVPAETARALARAYATTKPAALLPGWGPQRALYGEQFARAMVTLACITGNVGVLGGGLASTGTRANAVPLGTLPMGPHAPTRNLPSAAWARALLEDNLRPPVRMAYIVASNLANRSPDTEANLRALGQLDFVVVQDPFLTPTAQIADLVLPVCLDLERSDLVTSWGHDAHLFFSQQAVQALGEARNDYWIFSQLAERLGLGQAYTQGRDERQWMAHLLAASPLPPEAHGLLETNGLYRTDGAPRVALAEFRADPRAHPLPTPSGRIEIASQAATRYGLPPIPSFLAAAPEANAGPYPLQLVTPHSRLRSNSCVAANAWLQALETHALWMHPADAAARGIAPGAPVEVWNEHGRVLVPAKVTERIMPGVVCLYQGVWYRSDDQGRDVGGCANTLTSHRLTPSGGPTTHTVWVQARRANP